MINYIPPINPWGTAILEAIKPILEQVAPPIAGKSLTALRQDAIANLQRRENPDAALLLLVTKVSTIIYFYKIGHDPETWLRGSDELLLAKKLLGIPTLDELEQLRKARLEKLDQQKNELKVKGLWKN